MRSLEKSIIEESAKINEVAKSWKIDYTAYEGGIYSSEWVWAKIAHVLKEDATIRNDAYRFGANYLSRWRWSILTKRIS